MGETQVRNHSRRVSGALQEGGVWGTSLAVQWLGLRALTAGGTGSSLAEELRSCMPCGMAKKKEGVVSSDNTKKKRSGLLRRGKESCFM